MLEDTVLMFSGGIDSLAAWFYLDKPLAVYVDLRTPYSAKEFRYCQDIAEEFDMDLRLVSIDSCTEYGFVQSGVHAFFPSRNLFLAIVGSWYANNVCLAGIKGDLVEDKSPVAFAEMSLMLTKFSRRQISVFSPLWGMTKGKLVQWLKLEPDAGERALRMSVSCYHPVKHQCGECKCCFRKWVALRVAGVDPGFEVSNGLKNEYLVKAWNGYYDPERNEEIIKAVQG